jgi:hypothetical protein
MYSLATVNSIRSLLVAYRRCAMLPDLQPAVSDTAALSPDREGNKANNDA